MMPALSLCALAALPLLTLSSPAPAPGALELAIEYQPYSLAFHVVGPEQPFVGAVIGSLSPDQTHYFQGLPPLLTDFVLFDLGFGDAPAGYTAVLPQSLFPAGVAIYVQGVALTQRGLESTDVGEFVLDKTAPPSAVR